VEYEAVGMVLRDLGFDGCDLAVVPGSHIPPEKAGSDLMRGIEAVSGVGLEVPIISTSVTSGNDPNGRQILGIAGFMGIPLFRPGYWKYGNAPNREVRLAAVQREILGLASIARAYNIATALHNASGDSVGAGLTDLDGMLRNIDPRWVGYDFDPGFATETAGVDGAAGLTALATPKLKAVTVRDFTWNKDQADPRKATPCPLGEGIVDWRPFFKALARARFVGPITIEVRYETKDELNAFRHDLAFVRKEIAAAYTAV
jgi:sugar phosphate isomerase/epimerase